MLLTLFLSRNEQTLSNTSFGISCCHWSELAEFANRVIDWRGEVKIGGEVGWWLKKWRFKRTGPVDSLSIFCRLGSASLLHTKTRISDGSFSSPSPSSAKKRDLPAEAIWMLLLLLIYLLATMRTKRNANFYMRKLAYASIFATNQLLLFLSLSSLSLFSKKQLHRSLCRKCRGELESGNFFA